MVNGLDCHETIDWINVLNVWKQTYGLVMILSLFVKNLF